MQWAPSAKELDAAVDALELARAGERVGEVVAGGVPRCRVDQHAAGTSDRGEAAGEVDGAAVVVARLGEGWADGKAGAQEGKVLALSLRHLDQLQRRVEQGCHL